PGPRRQADPPPLYCKQDIFIFYIQWLIFLLIGNTMKNTMLRKGLTIF
ncbi:replication protein C, partial [Salmonella enterica subsp. enterica]|nr:replication protein C [Salmonella enterica subsp. enterica]